MDIKQFLANFNRRDPFSPQGGPGPRSPIMGSGDSGVAQQGQQYGTRMPGDSLVSKPGYSGGMPNPNPNRGGSNDIQKWKQGGSPLMNPNIRNILSKMSANTGLSMEQLQQQGDNWWRNRDNEDYRNQRQPPMVDRYGNVASNQQMPSYQPPSVKGGQDIPYWQQAGQNNPMFQQRQQRNYGMPSQNTGIPQPPNGMKVNPNYNPNRMTMDIQNQYIPIDDMFDDMSWL